MMDYDIERYIIRENHTLLEAMQIITKNCQGVGFVCENGRLLGALSDGDIRRQLIKANDLGGSVNEATNYNPRYVMYEEKDKAEELLYTTACSAIPIVDAQMHVICIAVKELHDKKTEENIDLPVVIMAGGKGSRLKPYTDVLPKPLIPIGNKTILERIIDNFSNVGCKEFKLITNYKKGLLKAYFGEIKHDYEIKFYEEEEFLGTGGGLKLLEDDIKGTFFVSNCDILVDCNYSDLLCCHMEKNSIITIVCVKKNVVIPYGVLETDECGNKLVGIREKPSYEVLINTGLYVIEPRFLKMIPSNTFIPMTDVIELCLEKGENIGTYIVDGERWLDMGQFDEMDRMKSRLLF